MRVFITGATGFVGNYLLKRLLKDKHNVKILSRHPEKNIDLQNKGIEIIKGSLDNVDAWKEALSGIDTVIHLAAPVTFWGSWDFYYKEITLASKKLFEVSLKQNVKRFIYISSESVVQKKDSIIDIDEAYPYPKNPNSNYAKAKKQAEIELLKIKNTKTKLIILRPAYIWGVRSKNMEALIDRVKSGGFVWIDQGKNLFETSHVKNVAEAIVLSLDHGKDRGIYFVTDDDTRSFREHLIPILKIYNMKIPQFSISSGFAYYLAVLFEAFWRIFAIKSQPPVSKFTWAFTAQPRRYDISKAKNELGYKPVISFEKGLFEIRNSLNSN